ncbi:MAG: HAMP domain-containing sensor histidine kinase [Actinomycetota bacterium]|jgi:signal transduction histidine kinase|nr:HAMP domain-containing sensor histidine kinase [Actinomycetota bacterium]
MTAGGRRRRFGLQARVIATFSLGAALVSAVLAVSTFYFVRRELLSQRTASLLHETFVNAHLVKVELGVPPANIASALSSVTTASGVRSLVYRNGHWYSSSAAMSGTAVPAELVRSVVDGNVADQRVLLDGVPTLVVGVPMPSIGVAYFEEHSLTELASTLEVLGTVLTTLALATTVGGALAGWWASRRLVKPLNEVVSAASEIAHGTLERRLPDDPDLQPLVASFNEMVTALQGRIERDARFASDVAHELRSPLTTIGASVELLDSYKPQLPASGAKAVEMLHVEVDRFSTMVEELLEIASMDAGADVLHFTDVPLAELVQRTVAGYDPAIPVSIPAAARDTLVRGDKRRLQQVLLNLLTNAQTHAGGAVGVDVATDGSWASISVDDAGPGIPPHERPHVFERFYRGAASGRRGDTAGSGLGLALVAEHVRAHEGTVRIGDSPAGGARISVLIPMERV